MRYSPAVALSDRDHAELVSLTRSPRVSSVIGFRARIVLALAGGGSTTAVASELGTSAPTVRKWRDRFFAEGVDGLDDRSRSGRPPVVDEGMVVAETLTAPPEDSGLTHWSSRELSKRIGISHNEIAAIWRNWGIQPHRTESFKFSTDPELDTKITDIIGLYMNPPENAIVLCIDEKSQVQALERSRPMLPVMPGLAEHRSHDYKRHGKTSLFAALEVATGRVTDQCHSRHTNKEFLKFLKHVAAEYPDGKLHIVVDNYRTHKHENVRTWLARPENKRIQLHFTPTGCSWMVSIRKSGDGGLRAAARHAGRDVCSGAGQGVCCAAWRLRLGWRRILMLMWHRCGRCSRRRWRRTGGGSGLPGSCGRITSGCWRRMPGSRLSL